MKAFLYSPFSPQNVVERNHPALLLLFILKELVKDTHTNSFDISSGPFGWAEPASSQQKLEEYFTLLPLAFPTLSAQVPTITHSSQQLFTLLEPFILACASNENVLLFLLRHQKKLAVKPLLDRIYPEGLSAIREQIVLGFRKRGYYFTKWTHSSQTSYTIL